MNRKLVDHSITVADLGGGLHTYYQEGSLPTYGEKQVHLVTDIAPATATHKGEGVLTMTPEQKLENLHRLREVRAILEQASTSPEAGDHNIDPKNNAA